MKVTAVNTPSRQETSSRPADGARFGRALADAQGRPTRSAAAEPKSRAPRKQTSAPEQEASADAPEPTATREPASNASDAKRSETDEAAALRNDPAVDEVPVDDAAVADPAVDETAEGDVSGPLPAEETADPLPLHAEGDAMADEPGEAADGENDTDMQQAEDSRAPEVASDAADAGADPVVEAVAASSEQTKPERSSARAAQANEASASNGPSDDKPSRSLSARSAAGQAPEGTTSQASPLQGSEASEPVSSPDMASLEPASAPIEALPSQASRPVTSAAAPDAPELPAGSPLPDAEEVVDPALAMRLMREANGVQRAEVALEHPLLGALRMELALDDGAVDLRVLVPSLAGALRLERDEGELRALLRDRGLRVASLAIDRSDAPVPEERPVPAETFVHHRYHWKA